MEKKNPSPYFSCRTCKKEDFSFEQMKKEKYLTARNRGICKPCDSNYMATRIMLAKAKKAPQDYLSCDDCDRIFSKYQVSRPLTKERIFQKLKTECPFCNSENIDRY
jgi:Zn finger protein HypA/HybF involved in hydrogenase expression